MSAWINVVGQTISTGVVCDACRQPVDDGEEVYSIIYNTKPWLAEDDDDNCYGIHLWHMGCDKGSLAADGARRA